MGHRDFLLTSSKKIFEFWILELHFATKDSKIKNMSSYVLTYFPKTFKKVLVKNGKIYQICNFN